MEESEASPAALVLCRSAAEADRRVAGLPAAARVVRELAEAGFGRVMLLLPAGDALADATWREIGRLAGTTSVEVSAGEPPMGDPFSVTRLVPASTLRGRLSGASSDDDAGAIDLAARGAALAILRGTGKASDGPVSRWLNRPLSRLLSALLLCIPGIRPLHATVGTALIAALMFAMLVAGGSDGLVAGALLFQAASVFDGVDGEIARATFRSSAAGAILDTVIDVATNCLLILGLAINLFERGAEEAVPLAAWGFTLFVLGLALIARRTRGSAHFSLDAVKYDYRSRFGGRLVPALIRIATIVSSRDFFALLFAILIVAGWPEAVLYLFAAAATVWILFVAASARDPSLAVPGS